MWVCLRLRLLACNFILGIPLSIWELWNASIYIIIEICWNLFKLNSTLLYAVHFRFPAFGAECPWWLCLTSRHVFLALLLSFWRMLTHQHIFLIKWSSCMFRDKNKHPFVLPTFNDILILDFKNIVQEKLDFIDYRAFYCYGNFLYILYCYGKMYYWPLFHKVQRLNEC